MSEQGYIVISDITGYTAFLSGSELEHAEDSLRSLLNLLIDHTRPPLVVSRLEGDAVISYAPQGSFLQGQTLVETVESTYVAFRRALERMVLNTTCMCNACRNIPSLDLKFFVHYGAFMLQQLGAHVEMVGSDVNLIHRLTKNGITEKTGFKAYATYTQAAVDALDIGELCGRFTTHTESYEHLGEVETYVQDLEQVWQRERSVHRVVVDPDDALSRTEYELPLAPGQAWDYATKPEYRAIVIGSGGGRMTGLSDGRIGVAAVYQCAHGKYVSKHTIVDWQPFEQYTAESTFLGATQLETIRLTPSETGTKVTVSFGKSRGKLVPRVVNDLAFFLFLGPRGVKRGLRRLRDLIEEDIAAGRVAQPNPADIASEEIEQAVAESLA